MPNNTIGSEFVHLSVIDLHFRATFNLAIETFYQTIYNRNCPPWSVVMTEGTPNCATRPATNALATVSAVISAIGIASGQCVKQSTHVSMYVKPFEDGNGPTVSRWIWSNRVSSVAKVENEVTVCRCIFNLWHCRHIRAHLLTSEFMFGHTNHAVTWRCVARIPGCESEWSESNTAWLKLGGTYGRSVKTLQTIVESDIDKGMSLRTSDEGDDFSQTSSASFSSVAANSLWSQWWHSVLHVMCWCVGEIMHPLDHFEHSSHEVYPRWIVKRNPNDWFALKDTCLSLLSEHKWGACDRCRPKIVDLQWSVKSV